MAADDYLTVNRANWYDRPRLGDLSGVRGVRLPHSYTLQALKPR